MGYNRLDRIKKRKDKGLAAIVEHSRVPIVKITPPHEFNVAYYLLSSHRRRNMQVRYNCEVNFTNGYECDKCFCNIEPSFTEVTHLMLADWCRRF